MDHFVVQFLSLSQFVCSDILCRRNFTFWSQHYHRKRWKAVPSITSMIQILLSAIKCVTKRSSASLY